MSTNKSSESEQAQPTILLVLRTSARTGVLARSASKPYSSVGRVRAVARNASEHSSYGQVLTHLRCSAKLSTSTSAVGASVLRASKAHNLQKGRNETSGASHSAILTKRVFSIIIYKLNNGSMPEWLKGMSCNLIGFCLRWFKSSSAHFFPIILFSEAIASPIEFLLTQPSCCR